MLSFGGSCAMTARRYQQSIASEPVCVFPQHWWPGFADVKRHAARAGRAKTQAKEDAARAKLRAALNELPTFALDLWARVVLIDSRFHGATGEGGWISWASRATNEEALAVLRNRSVFTEVE